MARIAGVNLPTNKRVIIALQYIHGIGQKNAKDIMEQLKIANDRRVNQLTDAEVLQIRELIDGVYKIDEAREELQAAQEQAKYEAMSEKQVAKEIKRLEKLMMDHSKNLEFEKAAQVRDQLQLLKEQLFGAPGADNISSISGL